MKTGYNPAMSKSVIATLILMSAVQPAFAHHPLDGQPMQTFIHGLLSGLAHPILGFDHLFFIIAAGVLAFRCGRALAALVALLVSVVIGVLSTNAGFMMPSVELLVALSVIVVGVIALRGKSLSFLHASLLFAILGVAHGCAFGLTIAAQEVVSLPVLAGYLSGLSLIQYCVALLAGYGVYRLAGLLKADVLVHRMVGAIVTGVGFLFLAGQV